MRFSILTPRSHTVVWLLSTRFHHIVYFSCSSGVRTILLSMSVGLPPNLTGCTS